MNAKNREEGNTGSLNCKNVDADTNVDADIDEEIMPVEKERRVSMAQAYEDAECEDEDDEEAMPVEKKKRLSRIEKHLKTLAKHSTTKIQEHRC